MTFLYLIDLTVQTLIEATIKVSIPLTIITFILGVTLGLLTALSRLSRIKLLHVIAGIYISIFRGTPLLVQLFIFFYGLPRLGIVLDPLPTAIIGFSLNIGAYSSETIRSSIMAIPKGQWEAAQSLGMSYTQMLRRIILPQALRIAIPPLSNTFISLVKDTSLASLVLVPEMFRRAQEFAASTNKVLEVYIIAAAIYWVICALLTQVQQHLEKRLSRIHQT